MTVFKITIVRLPPQRQSFETVEGRLGAISSHTAITPKTDRYDPIRMISADSIELPSSRFIPVHKAILPPLLKM
jgi:hypothetical protein